MKHWKTTELGEVLLYEQPTKYIVESEDYSEDYKIPVLTAGKSFILGFTDEKVGICTDVPVLIFDDFTTAIQYVDFPFKVKSSAMKILRADSKKADIKYLYYRMQKVKLHTNEHKRYWISKYSKIRIPLPPLEEQKKIAAILDAADAYRQKTKALIEKYDQLAQSIFLEMFGDIGNDVKHPIGSLADLIDIVRDGPHVSPKYSDSGVPILSTRNIRPFRLILEEVKYVSEEMYNDLTKRFKPQKGDVLLTKGGTTGFAKHVDWDWDFCIWVHLAALRVNCNRANPRFIEAALNSHYGYKQSQKYTRGIANKDLGLKRIIKIKIPIPSLLLQNQFAKRIELIETQKQNVQVAAIKTELLFNSLLQKAFKGELTSTPCPTSSS